MVKKILNRNGFTLIELLVVVAIIGILAAVGVVAYNGYTSSAKAKQSQANMEVVYKTWLNEKALCTVKGGRENALWNKTTCQVLLSSTTSDVSRVSGILMTYFGANNNYGFGQPILNTYRPMKNFFTTNCFVNTTQDANIGELTACWDNNRGDLVFNGCFKSPCSEASNRFQKRIDY